MSVSQAAASFSLPGFVTCRPSFINNVEVSSDFEMRFQIGIFNDTAIGMGRREAWARRRWPCLLARRLKAQTSS